MAKHTPGPWMIETYTNFTGWAVYASGGRGCIAERWYKHDQDSPYREELLANARLIAAAPDLLAACEKFVEWLDYDSAGSGITAETRGTAEGERAWRKWWDEANELCGQSQHMARAAIAKAKGEPTP